MKQGNGDVVRESEETHLDLRLKKRPLATCDESRRIVVNSIPAWQFFVSTLELSYGRLTFTGGVRLIRLRGILVGRA
jgi:hypothetical protein